MLPKHGTIFIRERLATGENVLLEVEETPDDLELRVASELARHAQPAGPRSELASLAKPAPRWDRHEAGHLKDRDGMLSIPPGILPFEPYFRPQPSGKRNRPFPAPQTGAMPVGRPQDNRRTAPDSGPSGQPAQRPSAMPARQDAGVRPPHPKQAPIQPSKQAEAGVSRNEPKRAQPSAPDARKAPAIPKVQPPMARIPKPEPAQARFVPIVAKDAPPTGQALPDPLDGFLTPLAYGKPAPKPFHDTERTGAPAFMPDTEAPEADRQLPSLDLGLTPKQAGDKPFIPAARPTSRPQEAKKQPAPPKTARTPKKDAKAPRTRHTGRIVGISLIALALGGMFAPTYPKLKLEAFYYGRQAKGAVAKLTTAQPAVPEPEKPVFPDPLVNPDGTPIVPVTTEFAIIIPKIGINAPVIKDVDPADPSVYNDALKTAVAHSRTSLTPDEVGTTYLFSHSTNYDWFVDDLNAVFYLVKNLNEGDDIVLVYGNVRYTYRMTGKRVVAPNNVSYLIPQTTAKKLTLQTCWPPGSTKERLLLFADLVDETSLTPAHTTFAELSAAVGK